MSSLDHDARYVISVRIRNLYVTRERSGIMAFTICQLDLASDQSPEAPLVIAELKFSRVIPFSSVGFTLRKPTRSTLPRTPPPLRLQLDSYSYVGNLMPAPDCTLALYVCPASRALAAG